MLTNTKKELEETTTYRGNTPREYLKIKESFQKAMEEGRPILVENNEFRHPYSIKMHLEYVGDRWCMGRVRYVRADGDVYIPYTINYSDMYSEGTAGAAAKNLRIIFKGGNPFGKGLEQGESED